jgi:predicted outer membrane repeat protein
MVIRRRLFLVSLALVLAAVSGCALRTEGPTLSFTIESLTAASFRLAGALGWARYEWRFGDGSTEEGRTATHTYEKPGEYTVDLKAVDVDGVPAFAHAVITAHRDIYVSEDRTLPRDYPTVQLAVDAAEPGDMILIEGEHVENILVNKELALRGPCTLKSATANPAIHVTADEVTLAEIAFAGGGDEATAGGALRLISVAIDVTGCSFKAHSGSTGGAVFLMESAARFVDCTFSENRADIDGGAVYCEGDRAFPTFVGCTFSDNIADAGGAIAIRAATSVALDATPLRVEGCTFERNRANGTQAGGAIHIGITCRAFLEGNAFTSNGPRDVVYE